MTVKCVAITYHQRRCCSLTEGKNYKVTDHRFDVSLSRGEYYVKSDSGVSYWYPCFLFKDIGYYRNEKINNLIS